MKTPFQLTETSMQRMEAHIPELAASAVRQAYYQALTTNGTVLQARHGQLVETSAEGVVRVIRNIAQPTAITPGTRRKLVLKG
jgi:hypothetical protein